VGGITRPRPFAERLGLSSAPDLPEIASGERIVVDSRSGKALSELYAALGSDFSGRAPKYCGPDLPEGLTHWGTIVQGPFDSGYGQDRQILPLADASSMADIERFPWPSPDDYDYVGIRSGAADLGDKARSLSIGWEPIFNRVLDLFGMEQGMINLHMQPQLIEAAVEHVEAFVLEKTRRALEAGVGSFDIFSWGDDFATHRGLFIRPSHWRRFFAPSYRRLIELVKRHDLKFNLHCCGTFVDVMPDLIDMGVDIWNPCQVHLPGNEPEFLKREFGKHITFSGAIDTQHTLPFGTQEDVRREVRERIDVLGRGGGYFCGPDHDVFPDVPVENLLALVDEVKSYRNEACTRMD